MKANFNKVRINIVLNSLNGLLVLNHFRSAELKNPEDRMMHIVKWFISSFSASRKVCEVGSITQ